MPAAKDGEHGRRDLPDADTHPLKAELAVRIEGIARTEGARLSGLSQPMSAEPPLNACSANHPGA